MAACHTGGRDAAHLTRGSRDVSKNISALHAGAYADVDLVLLMRVHFAGQVDFRPLQLDLQSVLLLHNVCLKLCYASPRPMTVLVVWYWSRSRSKWIWSVYQKFCANVTTATASQ